MGISLAAAALVGFVAETIDGALGMAYGLLSSTVLLAAGFPPAVASASVHLAEIATSAVSGLSHRKFGNVDLALAKRLAVSGVVGGVIGAYVLVSVPPAYLRAPVAAYLVVTGLIITVRAITRPGTATYRSQTPSGWVRASIARRRQSAGWVRASIARRRPTAARPGLAASVARKPPAGPLLGLAGGLCDAMGGGGWGQVVTSTLIARGVTPRFVVGTSTFSEFFVAAAESVAFVLTVGVQDWRVVGGLMAGGAVAAPLAAWSTSRLPRRALTIAVGLLVVATSLRTLWLSAPEWMRLLG